MGDVVMYYGIRTKVTLSCCRVRGERGGKTGKRSAASQPRDVSYHKQRQAVRKMGKGVRERNSLLS